MKRKFNTVKKDVPKIDHSNSIPGVIDSPYFPILGFIWMERNGSDVVNPMIPGTFHDYTPKIKKNTYKTGMFDLSSEDENFKISNRVHLPPLKSKQPILSESGSPSAYNSKTEESLPRIYGTTNDEIFMPGPYFDEDYYRLEKLASMKRNLVAQLSHLKSRAIRDEHIKIMKEEENKPRTKHKSHRKLRTYDDIISYTDRA